LLYCTSKLVKHASLALHKQQSPQTFMILCTCISSKYWARLASGPLLSIGCCSKDMMVFDKLTP